MPLDDPQLVDILLEFLEAFVHQILYLRALYSSEVFERHRLYGIAVRRARHPELVEYINEAVGSLKAPLANGTLAKMAVVITSTAHTKPLERFIVEPTLFTHQLNAPGTATVAPPPQPPPATDILDIEAQLRAALLRLQYSASSLPQLPPECLFQIVAYVAGRREMHQELWIEEQPPLGDVGVELSGDGEILPIKSCNIKGAFQLQCYIETALDGGDGS